jgi:hypothetical protein
VNWNDAITQLATGAAGLAVGVGSAIAWFRKNRVEGAKADLDVEALQAGSQMIQQLQGDLTRLRTTMIDADTKWRADMDKLEARLRDMSDQVDAAIVAKRQAEEKVARLRYQLQQLGQTPVE